MLINHILQSDSYNFVDFRYELCAFRGLSFSLLGAPVAYAFVAKHSFTAFLRGLQLKLFPQEALLCIESVAADALAQPFAPINLTVCYF